MNNEFSIALMKDESGSLNYQVRSTEIFTGFTLVFHGRQTIESATSFLKQEYYEALIGAGVLYFAPDSELLNSHLFNIDDHLLNRDNITFEPLCYYEPKDNTTTFSIVVRYFVIAESRFNPDLMYQCLNADFARLAGKKSCLSVVGLKFAHQWFEGGIINDAAN